MQDLSKPSISIENPGGGLRDLDDRSREIFRSIVESYLETGEPVGSRNVSRILPMSLSAASVRNVMSDLEHLGLIFAPHTSAGRLPTELGLRFFVDVLLEVGDVTRDEREAIEARVKASGDMRGVEQVLTEASQMLSGLSHGAGVVLTHKSDTRMKHIEFVRLEPTKSLVVLVAEDGSVETASSTCRKACPRPPCWRRRTISTLISAAVPCRNRAPRWKRCRTSARRKSTS